MSDTFDYTVRAVQNAVSNLLELVEEAARGSDSQHVAQLQMEAEKTVLMLLASIIVSDKRYESGEQAFVRLPVTFQEPAADVHFLRDYSERWATQAFQVPSFLQTALDHDTKHKTNIARAMMREIQLAGNNMTISDGRYDAVEHEVVRKYLLFLEEYASAWKAQPEPEMKRSTEGWGSV